MFCQIFHGLKTTLAQTNKWTKTTIGLKKIGPSDCVSCLHFLFVSVPKMPVQEEILIINSTSVTVFLDAWPNGGCPIDRFLIEYKQRGSEKYTLVTNSGKLEEVVIGDLVPAAWYSLKITAVSDPGQTVAEFVFATRTKAGGEKGHFLVEPKGFS